MWQKTRLWFHVQAVTSLNDSLYPLKKKKKKKDTYISTSLYRLFVENDFFPSTFHIKIVINYIDLHKIPGGKKKTTGHNLSFLSKNIIPSVQDLLKWMCISSHLVYCVFHWDLWSWFDFFMQCVATLYFCVDVRAEASNTELRQVYFSSGNYDHVDIEAFC